MYELELWPFDKSFAPWREFNRWQNDLKNFFSNVKQSLTTEYPAINVFRNETGAVIVALIPGIQAGDLDISVLGDAVTIKGKVQKNLSANQSGVNEDNTKTVYHRKERILESFSRTISLPFTIDSNQVNASYKNGILEIKLPMSPGEAAKKITIS